MSSVGWEGAFHIACYFPCWNVKYSSGAFPISGAFQRPQAPWEGWLVWPLRVCGIG